MKTTRLILATLAISASAFAGETVSKTVRPAEPECFRAHELSLDMFGQYSDGNAPSHAGPIRDHGWGGGVGLNYFFTRNFGLGLDAAWLATEEPSFTRLPVPAALRRGDGSTVTHNFSGSVIYRFPID